MAEAQKNMISMLHKFGFFLKSLEVLFLSPGNGQLGQFHEEEQARKPRATLQYDRLELQ